jgi:hypothetical protein
MAPDKSAVSAGAPVPGAPKTALTMSLASNAKAAFAMPLERKPKAETWFGGIWLSTAASGRGSGPRDRARRSLFFAEHIGGRNGARVTGVRSALQHSRHRNEGSRDSHRLRHASTTCYLPASARHRSGATTVPVPKTLSRNSTPSVKLTNPQQ